MRSNFKVFAALAAAALVATPFVMDASNARATPTVSEVVEMPAAVTPIEVAAVPAPVASQACARKVRVVYAGYAATSESCATVAAR